MANFYIYSKPQLKVKIKSLASEARIIHHEEEKSTCDSTRGCLTHHRTHDVRNEARRALTAYAFLRGKPFADVSRPEKWKCEGERKRVIQIAKRFGYFREEEIDKWVEAVCESV